MTIGKQIKAKAKALAIEYCKDIDFKGRECYNIGCEIACNEMADYMINKAYEAFCKTTCKGYQEAKKCFVDNCKAKQDFFKLLND